MVPRAVGFRIVWPEGVIFGSIMTYHVQFLLLVRQPLFDRAALPLTQTSWVLPPLSVGKMTLRLYGALNYSHGLSKGPSFGTGRGTTRSFSSTLLRRWPGSDRVQNLHRGEHEFAGLQLPWLSARQFAIFFFFAEHRLWLPPRVLSSFTWFMELPIESESAASLKPQHRQRRRKRERCGSRHPRRFGRHLSRRPCEYSRV